MEYDLCVQNCALYHVSAEVTVLSVKLIRLSDAELKKLHKDGRPSNVRFSEEDGGGSMGALNIIHLLHCVVGTLICDNACYVDFSTMQRILSGDTYILMTIRYFSSGERQDQLL
jgi:hypothetical protein